MKKRVLNALDAWGYYALAALCAAAILFSAVWTNRADESAARDMSAAADQNERLSDVQYQEDALAAQAFARPCAGEIVRGFCTDAVYFDAMNTWRTHEAIDFACAPGESVCAMRAGRVTKVTENEIVIDHGDGSATSYRGGFDTLVEENASVAPGAVIARGADTGTAAHGERGIVCVGMEKDGCAMDFSDLLRIEKD